MCIYKYIYIYIGMYMHVSHVLSSRADVGYAGPMDAPIGEVLSKVRTNRRLLDVTELV